MQYTVVHSKDPYLLARLATDLQMQGVEDDRDWNNYYPPFCADNKWMAIYPTVPFNFHPQPCFGNPIRHELTSRNYIKVLTQILQP